MANLISSDDVRNVIFRKGLNVKHIEKTAAMEDREGGKRPSCGLS